MVAIARPSSSRAGKAQRRQEVAAAETAVQEANLAQQRAADQLLRGLEALPFAALRSRTRRRTHFPTLVEHNGTLGSSGIRALLRCLKLILIKASTLTDQLQSTVTAHDLHLRSPLKKRTLGPRSVSLQHGILFRLLTTIP